MNQINCPECGKVFKIDETGYSNILKQLRDAAFEEEVSQRLLLAEKDKIQSIELAKKDLRIQTQKYLTTKNTEIQALQAKVSAVAAEKKLEVAAAKSLIEKERDTLAYQLEKIKENFEKAEEEAKKAQAAAETTEGDGDKDLTDE